MLFEHLPKQRKLPDDLRKNAVSLMKLNANKKVIQKSLSEKSGNIVLLKDLSNINSASKEKSTCINLENTIKILTKKYVKWHNVTGTLYLDRCRL